MDYNAAVAKVKLFWVRARWEAGKERNAGKVLCPAETGRRRPGRGKRKVYNRAAGIEILNYGITRLGDWRGAGGMKQRHGAENPSGNAA